MKTWKLFEKEILIVVLFLFLATVTLVEAAEPLGLYIQEYYKTNGRLPLPPSWVKVGTTFVYRMQVGAGTKGESGFTTQGYVIRMVIGIDKTSNYVAVCEWKIMSDLRGNIDYTSQIISEQFVELSSLEKFLADLSQTAPYGVQVQGGYLPDGGFYFAYASGDYQGFTRYNYKFNREGILVSSGFLEQSGSSSSVGQMELVFVKDVDLKFRGLSENLIKANPSYQYVVIEQMTGATMLYGQMSVVYSKTISEGFYSFMVNNLTNLGSSQKQILGTNVLGPSYINPDLLKGEIVNIPEVGFRWVVEGQGQFGGIQTGIYIGGVKVAIYEYSANGLLLQHVSKTHTGYLQAVISR
ncbi:MAG: hypothetical protein ACK4EZ_08110 [Fervidobacterium pennivorans]|uniref:Uncharacterized protein n=3 Tax=Fervidobacterium pennivorans TaxID=93466 RepID=A0A172T1J6_FERPE|nr:hypothetical protein [Fervidobacterium pennivorans]AFG35599.1 hypothetical protein Ferpe_1531 [Fervidobacterium pennivorans DSM 9078]ANE40713.1 hypothetical protein JM64_00740 [Fervidobacterium pennivorans]